MTIKRQKLACNPVCSRAIAACSLNRGLIIGFYRVRPDRSEFSRQPMDSGQPPAAMGVISGAEHQRQVIRCILQPGQYVGQYLRVKERGGCRCLIRQRSDPEQHDQRRSRVSVIPIRSPFSLIASLTILTVTASTRRS